MSAFGIIVAAWVAAAVASGIVLSDWTLAVAELLVLVWQVKKLGAALSGEQQP